MAPPTVARLIGVYQANGNVVGELAYLWRRQFRGEHCGLCDITHGVFREKPEWKRARDAFGVPFETVHLDERDPKLVAATRGHTPCVVADLGDVLEILLEHDELVACDGSPERFVGAVRAACDRKCYSLAPGRSGP